MPCPFPERPNEPLEIPPVRADRVLAGPLAHESPLEPLHRFAHQQ
jgi:hypothetical protein